MEDLFVSLTFSVTLHLKKINLYRERKKKGGKEGREGGREKQFP